MVRGYTTTRRAPTGVGAIDRTGRSGTIPAAAWRWHSGGPAGGSLKDRAPFTFSPPSAPHGPPRSYQPDQHAGLMADLLVVAGIAAFVSGMLALIWGLERV